MLGLWSVELQSALLSLHGAKQGEKKHSFLLLHYFWQNVFCMHSPPQPALCQIIYHQCDWMWLKNVLCVPVEIFWVMLQCKSKIYIYIKSLSNLCHCVAVCNTVTSKSSREQRMSNIFPSLFLSALSTQQDIELELALKAGKLIFIWDKYRKQIFSTAPNYESL